MSEPTAPEKQNLVQQAIGLGGDLFAWIKETLADEQARKAMVADLGLPSDPGGFDLPQDNLDSIDRYRKLRVEDLDEEAFLSALDDILVLLGAVHGFIEAAGVSQEAAVEEYAHRFFELMTLSFIRLRLPALYFAAQPFGVIEELLTTQSTAKAYPERFVSLFKGIGDHFENLGWGYPETEEEAKALSDFIFIPLSIALVALDRLLVKYLYGPEWAQEIGEDLAHDLVTDILYGWEILGDGEPPLADRVSDRTLSFLLQKAPEGAIDESISCTLMLVPRTHGGPALFVAFGGSGGFEWGLGDHWKLKFDVIAANAVDFLIHFEDQRRDAKNAGSDIGVRFSLEAGKDKEQRPLTLGISESTRLEFGRFSFSGELGTTGAGVKLVAEDSALVIDAAKDGDGFVSATLPAKETRVAFKFGLGWSTDGGFYLEGGAGLRAVIAIAKSIGPVGVQSLQLGLTPNMDGDARNLAFEAGATVDVAIGPVKASIDQVGFRVLLDFAKTDRNLGFVDLALGFKPPHGVGLAIDAQGIQGGGFLLFEPDKAQYGGVIHVNLDLKSVSMTLKAIGLINTRLPDGKKGFSLIVIITAEFIWPLSLGFTMTGLGLLLGINRTIREDVLQAGVKNRTLDAVLFPKDPIRNAPAILSTLGAVFPPAKGHHFVGGMVQIIWGKSPLSPLVTINLGLALEFGARSRLVVLGQVKSLLPKKENDLVRLQMDAVGIIDFDQKTAAVDASVYDSRLAKKFAMTGDMAMRLRWGDSPSFALAVGGLHPAFNPPPNFPKLERVAISLSAGDNPRLRCEAYFALTANTVQFGARAELYASAAGFTVQGEIGFDVLIQFDPFYFIAEFYAQLQLKRKSTNLFKVRVEGTLEGPRPLHVKAKATFEILWWDVSFRVDKTLIEGEKPPTPAPVDVLLRLREALVDPGSWISQLPEGQRQIVSVRARPDAGEILLHPLGTLVVKQTVVPLNLDIARFGDTTPAGARRFTIRSVSLGGQVQTARPVKDFFAPAQFFEMSDDEKLSRPSFEAMPAGVSLGSDAFAFSASPGDWLEVKAIEFDTFIMDGQGGGARPMVQEGVYELNPALLQKQARFGAAANSALRHTGTAKYRTAYGKHRVANKGWSIVATDDLRVQAMNGSEDGGPASYSEAAQALENIRSGDPAGASKFKILRPSELA